MRMHFIHTIPDTVEQLARGADRTVTAVEAFLGTAKDAHRLFASFEEWLKSAKAGRGV